MGPATIAFQAASWQCSSLDLDIIHRKVCGGTANLSLSYFHHVAKFQILLIWTLLYSDKNIYPHTHAEYSKSHATQLLHALYSACTTLMNYSWANRNAASDWLHRKVGGDLPKNNKKVKTRRCKCPRPWWAQEIRETERPLAFVHYKRVQFLPCIIGTLVVCDRATPMVLEPRL